MIRDVISLQLNGVAMLLFSALLMFGIHLSLSLLNALSFGLRLVFHDEPDPI